MKTFAQTHEVFFEAILSKGTVRAAEEAGCKSDGGAIVVPVAGRDFAVDPASGTVIARSGGVEKPAGFLESVVAVTYLARADGTPLSGEWVSEKRLELGEVYFRAPHELPLKKLADRFGKDPGGFVAAAQAIGGTRVEAADAGVEILALPKVPVRFSLWVADDEFPQAEVRALFDRTASTYLIPDGILALANLVVKRMLDANA